MLILIGVMVALTRFVELIKLINSVNWFNNPSPSVELVSFEGCKVVGSTGGEYVATISSPSHISAL